MSKKNKHKMSENFQSENDQEKEVLNSAEQNSETAQPDKEENNQEAQEETAETKLVKSEAEVADLKDRLLRQMAEFDNYRKRTMKEKAEIILNGSAGVVTDILPVIDDLERAIANSAKSEDYNALKEGVELIYNKLMHILEQKGLQKISPKNEPFDTDFHEAIAMIPAPSEDLKGKVLDCAIDGYKLKESDNKPKVSLTFEEICKIYYYDFNNLKISDKLKKTYERVRDHFILDCFLGQRFGDTPRITKENFCGSSYDTFRITQQKTGNKAVVSFNKLYGEYPIIVKEILEKYDYEAPFTGTMSTFNSRLHEICMYAGLTEEVKYEKKVKGAIEERTFKKYELISSHCARRTFITNAVKRKLHSQDIMRASGHTSEKSFGKYVIWGDDAK